MLSGDTMLQVYVYLFHIVNGGKQYRKVEVYVPLRNDVVFSW